MLFCFIWSFVCIVTSHTDWSIRSLDVPPSIHHGPKKILLQSQKEIISAVVLSQRAGAKYSRDIGKRQNYHQKEKHLHYPTHANGGTLAAVVGREYGCICAPCAGRTQHPERHPQSDAVYAHWSKAPQSWTRVMVPTSRILPGGAVD